MRRRILLAAAIVFIAFAGNKAFAHQQKAAITEVLFNERTGNIEVSHRFLLHDAEHALTDVPGVEGDLLSPDTQAAFAQYVVERFALADLQADAIPLTLLGAEIRGGFLWVYEEAPIREDLGGLLIRHDALRDVWPEQVNRVNVKHDGTIQTLIFDDADGTLQLLFEQ